MKPTTFLDPMWLWLFATLPFLLFFYFRFRRPRFPTLTVASSPAALFASAQRWSPPDALLACRLLTFACIVLAMANLNTTAVLRHQVPAEGIDIVLALDVSGSMLIEDIKPNRLEALKAVISQFVAGRSQDRMGLVFYAGGSFNACPLTQDYAYLLQKLNQLDKVALADGTAIGLGLASAVNALRGSKSKSKVIILLTDGENNAGYVEPATAAGLAKRYNIKVYTIGIGSMGQAPMPLYDLNGHKTYQYVPAELDEVGLRSIATQTGGKFFRAKDATTLRQIYAAINAMEQSWTRYHTEVKYNAQYRWFVVAGLLFFLLEMALKFTLLRTLA